MLFAVQCCKSAWTRGNGDKEAHGQQDRHDDGQGHVLIVHLLVFVARYLGRTAQGLHAHDQRLHQDDDAPQERLFQNGIAVLDAVDRLDVHVDRPVGFAHGDGHLFRAAHHDALNDGLAADIEFCHVTHSSKFVRIQLQQSLSSAVCVA